MINFLKRGRSSANVETNILSLVGETNYTYTAPRDFVDNMDLHLDIESTIGDKLTYSTSTRKLVIGSNINYIKISGLLSSQGGTKQNCLFGFILRKNDDVIIETYNYNSNSISYFSIPLPVKVISVQEGDELTFSLYIDTKNSSFATRSKGVHITIESLGLSEPLLNLIHPIGSLYMSRYSTSPATLFGGTWQQIKDVFPLAAGDTYTAGDTGGEATHILTIDEMPSHNHTSQIAINNGGNLGFRYALTQQNRGNEDWSKDEATPGNEVSFGNLPTGGGQAHNNMPPYKAYYMWERIA